MLGLYSLLTLTLLTAVVCICHLAGLPQAWTVAILAALLGAGVVAATANRRTDDAG